MTRILVIQGHPDTDTSHLCHALADSYAAGASAGGHDLRRIDIARLDFPLLRNAGEFKSGRLPSDISFAQESFRWAEHIVLVYPLWLGTMPALLKAFLEQVLRPGFAFEYVTSAKTKKGLTGRSCRVVVTMGMPSLVYRWFFGAHSLKSLERNILKFVGISPVRESLFGMVEQASEARRRKWLDEMRGLGTRAG